MGAENTAHTGPDELCIVTGDAKSQSWREIKHARDLEDLDVIHGD